MTTSSAPDLLPSGAAPTGKAAPTGQAVPVLPVAPVPAAPRSATATPAAFPLTTAQLGVIGAQQIGRASCRERV